MFERIEKEVLVKEGKMRNGIYMIVVMLLVLMGCATIGKPPAHALEPKLLWEKEFEGSRHLGYDLAETSGDVIIRIDKEVMIYDKDGNERFHWGPRVDRYPTNADISNDGKYFAINTDCTAEYAAKMKISVWECGKVHFYSCETKKELWNDDAFGGMNIFPDGSGVIFGAEEFGFYTQDVNGKMEVNHDDDKFGAVTYVSPDGKYIGTVTGKGNELFSRSGEGLWAKEVYGGFGSITDDAKYVALAPPRNWRGPDENSEGAVFDKEGNVVFERFGYIAGNGTRVALQSDDWTRIMSLPEKTLLKEVPVNADYAEWSHDGRVVVLYGNRTDGASGSNVFIYDLKEGTEWETNSDMKPVVVASDGKYLLFISVDKRAAFYQLNKLKGVEGWVRPIKNMISFAPEANKIRRWSYV